MPCPGHSAAPEVGSGDCSAIAEGQGQAQCPHYCTHFTDEETEAAGLEGLSDLLGSEWWLSRVGGKEQAGRGSRAPDLRLTRAPAPVLGGVVGQ